MSNDGNDDDVCIACNIALKNGDKFYLDVDGGYLHAACAGPEREGYVGADGKPLKDGDPIPEPKTWVHPPPSSPVAGGGEELLQKQREAATAWMEAIGWLPKSYEGELHGVVEDAFAAGQKAALLSSPRVEEVRREAFEEAAKVADSWGGYATARDIAERIRALSLPQGE